jgi:hypothetical protein
MNQNTLASCAKCWFNGLQYGSVGLSMGYCSEHRVTLRRPDQTTCGRHVRKDLLLKSSKAFHHHHGQHFPHDKVVTFHNRADQADSSYIERSTSFLRHDSVGDVVADYGEYDSKIESLAKLRSLSTYRSEIAMLSLGRAYTNRCVERGESWTSGIHLLWWTRRRLVEAEVFDPTPSDLRYSTAGSSERQLELAGWSLLMLRLMFISDLGTYAEGRDASIEPLKGIAEQAAQDTQIPSKRKLLTWIKKTGIAMLEDVLPESRYRSITASLLR